jgi:hypothetical protein
LEVIKISGQVSITAKKRRGAHVQYTKYRVEGFGGDRKYDKRPRSITTLGAIAISIDPKYHMLDLNGKGLKLSERCMGISASEVRRRVYPDQRLVN